MWALKLQNAFKLMFLEYVSRIRQRGDAWRMRKTIRPSVQMRDVANAWIVH